MKKRVRESKIIYLDKGATTPVCREVLKAMAPFWSKSFGNPGSITRLGVLARQTVEEARKKIAELIIARPQEIIFTASGTESNNLAIMGTMRALSLSGIKISDCHFITTNIEHGSVQACFVEIARLGGAVDFLPVEDNGLLSIKTLRQAIKPNTVLVSIGYANNEIGVVQSLREIAKEIRYARKKNIVKPNLLPYFHTDASQAGSYLNLNVWELGIDLMTLDAQKIYGPKGVGALFIKAGTDIAPIIFGGGQENGLRPGTENVPGIVGLVKALELARNNFSQRAEKVKKIRDYFWKQLKKDIPKVLVNGDLESRLPDNLNISFPDQEAELLVLRLDEKGIVCSAKSACHRSDQGSAVIRALCVRQGLTLPEVDLRAKSALRFSLSEDLTKKDIDYVVRILKSIFDLQIRKEVL